MNKLEAMIREFNNRFGCTTGDIKDPKLADVNLRINLIDEEFQEFVNEAQWGRFESSVHELFDLLYVTVGALVAFGITDLDVYLEELHAANMRKVGGKSREDGKVLKPEGWQPAQIERLVKEQKLRVLKEIADSSGNVMPIVPQETMDKIKENSEIFDAVLPSPHEEPIDEEFLETVKETVKRGRPRRSS